MEGRHGRQARDRRVLLVVHVHGHPVDARRGAGKLAGLGLALAQVCTAGLAEISLTGGEIAGRGSMLNDFAVSPDGKLVVAEVGAKRLVSIDPQQILAAQELWTFNTKNRMLTVYRAQDQGGLGVKTVRITGYNESTSISKRLRKPESVLQSVLSGGKPTLRTVMDNITTKPGGFSSRITTDTILLRVVR